MKPYITTISLVFIISFAAHSQKWLWVREGINQVAGSEGDPAAVTVDYAGNVIEAGSYNRSVSFGPYTLNHAPAPCVFMLKYDSVGNILWATNAILNSAHCAAFGFAVAVDRQGNSFVTGRMVDSVSFGVYLLSYPGQINTGFFIAKLDASGNVLWAKNAGVDNTSIRSAAYSIATDASGNVYATGNYAGNISFGSITLKGKEDKLNMFVVKYDANGNVVWAKNAGLASNTCDAGGGAITVDQGGSVYVTGEYSDTVSIGPYTFANGYHQGSVFLAKYDAGGNVLWAKADRTTSNAGFGGGLSIITDNTGNIYIGGDFNDTLVMGSKKLITNNANANGSTFLAKYSPSGNLMWAEKATTANAPQSWANNFSLSTDKWCNVYACGTFQDSIYFNGMALASDSIEPSYIFKFDSSGYAVCGTVINNVNDDFNGVAANPFANSVYFTGDAANLTDSVASSSCVFGDTTLSGKDEWAFLGKWTCPCKVHSGGGTDDTICEGSSVKLNASGGNSFSWSPSTGLSADNIADPVASPTVTTVYKVIIGNGECSAPDSVNVLVHPKPIITYCCDSVIDVGQHVQLISTGGTQYAWTPSDGLSCSNCPDPSASPYITTYYTVTVTDNQGCSATGRVEISVNCGSVFVPEAFSPNGDGHNDFLYVRGNCIKAMDFLVFDRWGNVVFECHNTDTPWDGTYKGRPLNTGSYVYYLDALMYDGTSMSRKGGITLVR